MNDLRGTKTAENLLKAFAGESQARNRYTYYAAAAEQEGYIRIAQVFRETAMNEESHARRFFGYLCDTFHGEEVPLSAGYPVGMATTEQNLGYAAAGEHDEWSHLYPTFGDIAEQEGFPEIAACFRFVAKAEVRHEARYNTLRENLRAGTLFQKDEEVEWKCEHCGYVHTGKTAPEVCPTCLKPQGWFGVRCESY